MSNGVRARAIVMLGVLFLAAAPGLTGAQSGATSQIKALAGLRSGQWEMRELDTPGAPPRSFCLADPALLMQVQHRAQPCSRLVLENADRSATVHYTCPAGGFGRTTMRLLSERAVVIDTQGIDRGRPFAYRAEMRRTGACRGSRAR